MQLLVYKKEYEVSSSILDFTGLYYSLKMKYLASDLLKKGLSPKQITKAVKAAAKIVKSSGIEPRKHFMPVFSGIDRDIIKDCKLSQLAYGMVLMNANRSLAVVGKFQAEVLKDYLDRNTMT